MKQRWNSMYDQLRARFGTRLKTTNPLLAPHFSVLESRVRGAMQFLKNNFIHQHGDRLPLNLLPWFLIIGNSGSGKTAMLANSNIRFVLDKKIKGDSLKEVPTSESCDWWVTTNTVLIDVPGKYISFKAKKASLSNKLWEHFLNVLQTLRGQNGISGIIIAISLTELFDKENYAKFIETLRFRMQELQNKFGTDLPFYITITKCDLIPGFVEFFSEYSKEELLQAWGIPLPMHSEASLLENFLNRFNALIKRLNEQVISRLHQERSMHTKYYIKDFPLQLERLKESLSELIRKLSDRNFHFVLKGIYLTSALQHENTAYLSEQREIVLANQFQQALAIMQPPAIPSQTYFIKQFLSQCLIPRPMLDNQTAKNNKVTYVTAAIFASIFLLYGGHFFITKKITQPVLLAKANEVSQQTNAVNETTQHTMKS